MTEKQRVDAEPAYILHTYSFRETSLVAEAFTEHHGRVALIARGARRPRSPVRGLLQPFQPLRISWFGKGEVRTLHDAEWEGGMPALSGLALMCGFYLNELLLRLLPRDDPHERLFTDYSNALSSLTASGREADTLRRFELRLLREIGYAPTFTEEAETGRPVRMDAMYHFRLEKGVFPATAGEPGLELSGQTLLGMAAEDYSDPVVLREAKQLTRMLLGHYLGDKPLHSRQLLKELLEL
jgi:DNA repair protein RecO (recombination protein O)